MLCKKCGLRGCVDKSPMCRRCYERAFGGPPESMRHGGRADWKPNRTPSAFRPKADPILDPDEYVIKRGELALKPQEKL